MERTRKPTRGAGAWAAIGAGDITKPGGDVFALTQGMGPAKPDDVAAFDRTIRDWLEDHHTRGLETGFEVEDFPGSKQMEIRAGRESRIINTDTWPYLTKVREFFAKHESKKPEYTEGPEGTMNEAKAIEAFAAKKGLSVAELEEAADNYKAAKAELLQRATTTRATAAPRPDWIKARKQGVKLADFIKDKFADDLAAETMTRAKLRRYASLYQAYFDHLDQLPPELQSIPTKSKGNDRLVVDGKVKPARPVVPPPPRTDEMRRFDREAKQVRAALRRGAHSL